MADKEATSQEPVSLEDMLGLGKEFKAGGHVYDVLPLKLKEVKEYTADLLWAQTPVYVLENEEGRAKADKWMQGHLRTKKGEPVSLEMATDDDWDTEDLKRFFRRLAGISG